MSTLLALLPLCCLPTDQMPLHLRRKQLLYPRRLRVLRRFSQGVSHHVWCLFSHVKIELLADRYQVPTQVHQTVLVRMHKPLTGL